MASVRQLYVALTLRAESYNNAMRAAQRETKEFEKNIRPMTTALNNVGQTAKIAGAALTAGLTVPLVAVAALSTKAAREFESSFAGVRKTVNATDAEFAALSMGLRELSKEIPVNVNELNKIAEAAGQLGIQKESILGFTRVMADLGVATNLSSEEAATALARLANITQMSQDDFDRLGSTIVALGNNFATTESEIVDFALRIAGAGKIAGLTEHQILAIGAAMSSVGVQAESGGTAVQKVLNDMTEAVATNNKSLAIFAATAGMSAQEFATAFKQDAGQAFAQFVAGLGAQGDKAFKILDGLKLGNERVIRAFLSLAGAGDLLARSLELAGRAWQENTALAEEAARRYATFDSQLQLFKNRLNDVAIIIGAALLPVFLRLIDMATPLVMMIGKLADWFAKLPAPVQAVAVGIAALAAAAGPLLFVFGSILTTFAGILPALLGAKAAFVTLGTAIAPVIAAIAGISAPVLAAVVAITAIVAAIAAMGVAVVLLISRNEDMKARILAAWQNVRESVGRAVDSIAASLQRLWTAIRPAAEALAAAFSAQLIADITLVARAIEYLSIALSAKLTKEIDRAVYWLDLLGVVASAVALKAGLAGSEFGKTSQAAGQFANVVSGSSTTVKSLSDSVGAANAKIIDMDAVLESSGKSAKAAAEEWKRLQESFSSALRPADELEKTLRRFFDAGRSNADILKVYGDEIINTVESQKAMGNQVSATMADLYAHATAVDRAAEAEEDWNKATLANIQARVAFDKVLKDSAVAASDVVFEIDRSKQANLDGVIALGKMRMAVDETSKKLRGMIAAGASHAEIMATMGSELQQAADMARKLDMQLDPLTETILRQEAAAQKHRQRVQELGNAWGASLRQLTTGMSDIAMDFLFDRGGKLKKNQSELNRLAKEFGIEQRRVNETVGEYYKRVKEASKANEEWDEMFKHLDGGARFFSRLGELAKTTARSMLDSMVKGFISPFTDAMEGLGRRAGDWLGGLIFGGGKAGGGGILNIAGLGGGGGLLGKIPGLGGIFGAGAAATAGGMAPGIAGLAAMAGTLPSGAAIMGLGGAATATAGTAGAAAGGAGMLAAIGSLATNPITIAAAGGLALWYGLKKYRQGADTADRFVERAQDPFNQVLSSIVDPITAQREAGTLSAMEAGAALEAVNREWAKFQARSAEFIANKEGEGGKEQLVVDQAMASLNPLIDRIRADLQRDIDNASQVTAGSMDAAPFQAAVEVFREAVDRFAGMPAATAGEIPHLAEGGLLNSSGLVFAHAGEVVTPFDELRSLLAERVNAAVSRIADSGISIPGMFGRTMTAADLAARVGEKASGLFGTIDRIENWSSSMIDRMRGKAGPEEERFAIARAMVAELKGQGGQNITVTNSPTVHIQVDGNSANAVRIREMFRDEIIPELKVALSGDVRGLKTAIAKAIFEIKPAVAPNLTSA